MRMQMTRKGREVHGWEKACGVVEMIWGLLLIPVTLPIRLITGRWPCKIATIDFGK